MNIVDIVIVLIVVAIFVLCIRSLVKGAKKGQCADCSSNGSCNAHKGGHCQDAEHLVAQAAAAAKAYEAKK